MGLDEKNDGAAPQLIAMFTPVSMQTNEAKDVDHFKAVTGFEPRFIANTLDYRVVLRRSDLVKYASGCGGEVALFLHGEVYASEGESSPPPEQRLLDEYLRSGVFQFAKSIHGSCAVLIVDSRHNRIAFVTDRVNSKKLFVTQHGLHFWVSTSLRRMPACEIDPAGVASYMINRYVYLGRTVLKDVVCLEGANVHVLERGGVTAEPYWRFEFADSAPKGEHKTREDLSGGLSELLEQAVVRRLRGDGRVVCSLSGGLDSRVIFRLLLRNERLRPRLHTLIYGEAGDDPDVATLLAEEYGVPQFRYGFNGDMEEALKINGEYCEGAVFFYPRLPGFVNLGRDFSRSDVLFVGDECFGWQNMPLASFDDVLTKAIGIRSPVTIPNYYDYGKSSSQDIQEVLNSDNLRLQEQFRGSTNWHDIKDILYLTQRLPYMLLTWREFHASSVINVANPWLDNDILDFMRTVPTELRLDKQLFRMTAADMFNDLTRIRFAKPGGLPNSAVHLSLLLQRESIKPFITSYDSMLDDVFPPDLIMMALLDLTNQLRLDTWRIPKMVRMGLVRLMRKYRQTHMYFGASPTTRQRRGRTGRGLMSLGPLQIEALLALRSFLRKD